MRIALVHDYLKEYGGAERVLEALHELYPDAPVFTSVYLPEFLGPHRERFKQWDIQTSSLQKIPFKAKLISPFRLLAPFAFKKFNLSEYDVVIVSATGAYISNAICTAKHSSDTTSHRPIFICYCHTPPRYLYGYATARNWGNNMFLKTIVALLFNILRTADFSASKNVDYYIANSHEVAGRIKKFYRRDAAVIYPPVDIPSNSVSETPDEGQKKEYFLTGGRLARPKHIELIIKTCIERGVPLKIFGKAFAGYGEELKKISGVKGRSQISFLDEVNDEEKYKLMQNAKAFLFAAEDEDLGITPIEAMSVGLPVIAYRSGGVRETVIDGKTGLFFDHLTIESMSAALQQFENIKFDPEICKKRAEEFSKERFIKEIKTFVEEHVAIK